MPPERRPWLARLVQATAGTAVTFAGLFAYLAVLRWRGPAASLTTQTQWDRLIPFSPLWIWVYMSPYVAAPPVYALFRRATFWWLMRRYAATVALSALIFVLLPTKTVRPETSGLGDGPSARLYLAVRDADDPPANAAPSLHVSLSCLYLWALRRDYPRAWPLAIPGVVLLWLSTLFTWQHHLPDVLTGALLGSLVALLPLRPAGTTGTA